MIKGRASGSKVYLYFMKKGTQARHRISRNSCCCFTEQIIKFTFHLHDAKAYRLTAKSAFCVLNKMQWGHDCLAMSCTLSFALEYFCMCVQ